MIDYSTDVETTSFLDLESNYALYTGILLKQQNENKKYPFALGSRYMINLGAQVQFGIEASAFFFIIPCKTVTVR